MADGWTALAHSTSQLPALGMGMVGMRQRNEDRDIALGISQERLAMQEETAKQTAMAHQAQIANAEAKIPKDQQVFDPSMVAMAEGATLKQWGPTVAKSLTTHLLDPLREIAAKDEKSTFGDAHAVAKSIWGTAREGLSADLSKALASGKLSPEESKKVAALLDTVQYDPEGKYVIDQGVFKNTYEAIRQREDNSAAALEAQRQAGQADKPRVTHAPPGSAILDVQGNIIGMVPKDTSGTDTKRQDRLDKEEEQKKQKAINRINETIDEYDKEIKAHEKESKDMKPDKKFTDSSGNKYTKKWYDDAIEQLEEAKTTAKRTRAKLQNDEISHKEINWGGGSQPADNRSVKLVEEGWGWLGGDKADPKNWKKMP